MKADYYSQVLNKSAMLHDKYSEQEIQELFEVLEGESETAAAAGWVRSVKGSERSPVWIWLTL